MRADALEADVWGGLVGLFSDLPKLERLLRIAQREEPDALEGLIAIAEQDAGECGEALRHARGSVAKTWENARTRSTPAARPCDASATS